MFYKTDLRTWIYRVNKLDLLVLFIGLISSFYMLSLEELSLVISIIYFLACLFIVTARIKVMPSPMVFSAFFISIAFALYQFNANLYFLPFSEGYRTSGGIAGGDDMGFVKATQLFIDEGVVLHSFALWAGVFCYPLSIIKQINHLDFLIFNAVGHAMMALFIAETIYLLTKNQFATAFGFYSSLCCGFLIYEGLSFLRDGWTATLLAIAVWALVQHRFFSMLVFVLLLGFVRPGSGAVALLGIFFIIWLWPTTGRFLSQSRVMSKNAKFVIILVLVGIVLLSSPFMITYLQEKGVEGSLFRGSFVEHYELNASEDNVFASILQMPFYLRTPLSYFHYIFAPYFRLSYIDLVPEKLFPGIYSLWFVFVLPSICRAVCISYRTKNYEVFSLFQLYLFVMFVLSQTSLQLRHKAMVLPILIILASYGMTVRYSFGTKLGIVLAILTLLLSLGREIMFVSA